LNNKADRTLLYSSLHKRLCFDWRWIIIKTFWRQWFGNFSAL